VRWRVLAAGTIAQSSQAAAFGGLAVLAPALRDRFDLTLSQVGVMLAERLQMPHSTIIMEVQIESNRLRVKRELEGGWFQWIAIPLPALLTIQSGINQLRYATLKGIMAAKKKEIKKVALAGGLAPAQQIVALASPTRSKQTQMITGSAPEAAKDLVRRLREEARAL